MRTMLKNMCRVCGRYAAYKNSLKIFENQNMLWSIQVLTGLVLENAECLPKLICICCQTELREAIRFSERVITVQKTLLSALAEEELLQLSEEYREAVRDSSGNYSQNVTKTKQNSEVQFEPTIKKPGADEELILKAQHEGNEIIIEEHGKQEDLMEYDFIIDDDIICQQADHQESQSQNTSEDHQFAIASEDSEKSAAEGYILPDKGSDEEFEVLDRVLNDEIATAQSIGKRLPVRKRIANLRYVCDECGNHISGRIAFELHCRRHRGDKQYECDICQDRFCTGSELKRHMRRHTGERPFACQYCGRCFTDYSTRVKHERTHTNERPYACQNCGKAFTTAYILKNHMLIHSGERAFSCELCNKTFIRQTHLVTHCRSSAHKRNLERQNQEIKIES